MSRIGLSDLGKVDRESDVPLYRQISDRLLRLIEDGILISGDMLPSGPELSRHFAVAPMTVREALNALRSEGRIVSEKGRGVYVSAPPPLRTALRTVGIVSRDRPALLGAMPSLPSEGVGGDFGAIDVKSEVFPSASFEARSGFTGRITIEFPHGDGYALTRYAIDWRLPMSSVDEDIPQALEQLRSMLDAVDSVSETISARPATPREVTALSIPRDLPVLVTTHVGSRRGEAIAEAETVRDSRFPIRVP
jgi:hypothetical protein